MKDGFDRSVAEKMPRIQKKRPNRPWNVDPVQLKTQEQEEERPQPAAVEMPQEESVETLNAESVLTALAPVEVLEPAPVASVEKLPEIQADVAMEPVQAEPIASLGKNESVAKAVETIKELSSEFTQMIFDRKEIQQQLEKNASSMEEVLRENARLKESLEEVGKSSLDSTLLDREIGFLNEQLEDADLYIQNMVGLLEERMQTIDQESSKRRELEARFGKVSREIQEKAKMDVKVSILERDLSISNGRILELESKLEEEYQKREPLELEIVELKSALDKVYSSLAHIRLKAKREVYGS